MGRWAESVVILVDFGLRVLGLADTFRVKAVVPVIRQGMVAIPIPVSGDG